ncbi:hypothetical protein E2C01_017923 [Portunus trituberculatus]|uniref:Uncharacterized protein n=1 Tax=Portunus trituberculatus TaxID=210409 RepID=A0A5B7DTR0_PORTR|nr:hypothetical protein [Portunus trituberculatus]
MSGELYDQQDVKSAARKSCDEEAGKQGKLEGRVYQDSATLHISWLKDAAQSGEGSMTLSMLGYVEATSKRDEGTVLM